MIPVEEYEKMKKATVEPKKVAEKVGKRYAKALFNEAVSAGSLDAIYADLGLIYATNELIYDCWSFVASNSRPNTFCAISRENLLTSFFTSAKAAFF